MQRTATAGFYAGFVGQGIEYTQIISNADYQLSMIITSAKGVNSINNPLSYLLCIKDFLLTQTIDAAKAGLQDAWNGTYDSAIGRKMTPHPFPLSTRFGTLDDDLGCLPLDDGAYPPPTHCRNTHPRYSEFGCYWYPTRARKHPVALPPRCNQPTLHLNAFRREPAITEFDWPFTPSPRSSPRFSTQVGSVLHAVLPALQPAQG